MARHSGDLRTPKPSEVEGKLTPSPLGKIKVRLGDGKVHTLRRNKASQKVIRLSV